MSQTEQGDIGCVTRWFDEQDTDCLTKIFFHTKIKLNTNYKLVGKYKYCVKNKLDTKDG